MTIWAKLFVAARLFVWSLQNRGIVFIPRGDYRVLGSKPMVSLGLTDPGIDWVIVGVPS